MTHSIQLHEWSLHGQSYVYNLLIYMNNKPSNETMSRNISFKLNKVRPTHHIS